MYCMSTIQQTLFANYTYFIAVFIKFFFINFFIGKGILVDPDFETNSRFITFGLVFEIILLF